MSAPEKPAIVPALPAATVVLLRDTSRGFETLLLRRHGALNFAARQWVFPGGRIEADEFAAADDPGGAARLAAVRETAEETALNIDPESLHYYSHWTTPERAPKRFATWFFLAPYRGAEHVVVDGGEIDDAIWLGAESALQRHREGRLDMMPPTFVTLVELAACRSAREVLARATHREPPRFLPRLNQWKGGGVALYEGDAGYPQMAPDQPGPRHRLVMDGYDWTYINEHRSDW